MRYKKRGGYRARRGGFKKRSFKKNNTYFMARGGVRL